MPENAKTVDAIKTFAEKSGLFGDWNAFKPSVMTGLKGEARAKFNVLMQQGGRSGHKTEPRVFNATVGTMRTAWLTLENEFGSQAYVFDAFGRPLASAYRKESGAALTWKEGFELPEHLAH